MEILSITCLSWLGMVKDSKWGINVARVNWLTYLEITGLFVDLPLLVDLKQFVCLSL